MSETTEKKPSWWKRVTGGHELEKLKEYVETQEQAFQELREQHDSLQQTHNKALDTLKETQQQLQSQKEALEEYKQIQSQLSAQNDGLNKQFQTTFAAKTRLEEKQVTAEQLIAQQKTRINGQERALKTANEQISNLQLATKHAEQKNQQLEQVVNDLSKKLNQSNQTQREFGQLQKQNQQLQQSFDSLQQQYASLEAAFESSQHDKNALQKQSDEQQSVLQKKLEQADTKLATAKTKAQKATDELEALKAESVNREKQLAELIAQNERYESELQKKGELDTSLQKQLVGAHDAMELLWRVSCQSLTFGFGERAPLALQRGWQEDVKAWVETLDGEDILKSFEAYVQQLGLCKQLSVEEHDDRWQVHIEQESTTGEKDSALSSPLVTMLAALLSAQASRRVCVQSVSTSDSTVEVTYTAV